MSFPRIITAKAISDTSLVVKFTNQAVKLYDISQLFGRPMFAPLQQPAFFKNFTVEPGGYGLVWNQDIDISEYEIWQNGVSIEEDEFPDLQVPQLTEQIAAMREAKE
jgi:hypothetical protein